MHSPDRWYTRIGSLICAALALHLTGCGGGVEVVQPKTALRGKITVAPGQKPLLAGQITAYRKGEKVSTTSVNPDGSFEFINVPTGDYQLAITDTAKDTPYGKGIKLKSKYADPAQSGLTVSVAGNDSPRDFSVEPE